MNGVAYTGVAVALFSAGAVQAASTDFPSCDELAKVIGAPVQHMVAVANPMPPENYLNHPHHEGRRCIWKWDMADDTVAATQEYAASIGMISLELRRGDMSLSTAPASSLVQVQDATLGVAQVVYPYETVDLSAALGRSGPRLVVEGLSIEIGSTFFPTILPEVTVGWAIAASQRVYAAYNQQAL